MFKTLKFAAALIIGAAGNVLAATEWSPLLSPIEVSTLEGDPLLIDIRDAEGAPGYGAGHPVGSVNAPYAKWRGPKENPGQPLSNAALTALLRSIGAEKDRPTVIIYQGADATDFGAAARVYWTLKSAGLTRIAIMDGGVNEWLRSRLPMEKRARVPEQSGITATLSTEWMATRADVAAISSGTAAGTLIDARPEAFLKGEKKHPAAAKAGTLNGATQFTHARWFADENNPTVGNPGGLLGKYRAPRGEGPVVSFCNTGHWAATNWFMLSEIEKIEGVKLYPESLVGWTGAGGATVTH